jgi:arachidonate 15-lipoxygenase
MRVAGPNPVVLTCQRAPDPRFPVTDEQYAAAMGPGDSLARALDEGRVFLADYAALEGLPPGTVPRGRKFASPALAMFAVPPRTDGESRALRPVAIQCAQAPGSAIFTPRDGTAWAIAKTLVSTADASVHELSTHLGRTHLLVEPIVVAAHRNLDERHPLLVLLAPHFEGTLFINNAAHSILLAPGGAVDVLHPFTIESMRAFAARASGDPPFDRSSPAALLRARGTDDPDRLPDFPYRDDAQLVWEAIREWVASYLALYYEDDAAVRADTELQDWVADLRSPDGGRVNGFGAETPEGRPSFLTLESLVEAVTLIVFTASAQHGAVNAPQYQLMSYAPCFPLSGYSPAPLSAAEADDTSYLANLPPLDIAETQLDILYVLGSVQHTKLGEYPLLHFRDERVETLLSRFQDRLAEVENTINERNAERTPYSFLLPSTLPRSINI